MRADKFLLMHQYGAENFLMLSNDACN